MTGPSSVDAEQYYRGGATSMCTRLVQDSEWTPFLQGEHNEIDPQGMEY